MKFKTIPTKEKTKETNKLINYVKKRVKENDGDEMALYNACETAGYMLYEFLCDYIEEESK